MDLLKKDIAMRPSLVVLAWLHTLVSVWVIAWPALSSSPFPLPGYRHAELGLQYQMLTAAAAGVAVAVTFLWQYVRRYPLPFISVCTVCFALAVVFVSVPLGTGFAMICALARAALPAKPEPDAPVARPGG